MQIVTKQNRNSPEKYPGLTKCRANLLLEVFLCVGAYSFFLFLQLVKKKKKIIYFGKFCFTLRTVSRSTVALVFKRNEKVFFF